MKVILSIKPEFAEKIFNGSKKYEFRRSIFKDPTVNKIIVYASAPISKIIGEFEIDKILRSELASLWSKTKEYSGISEEYYLKYFEGKKEGYALKIKKTHKYEDYLSIKDDLGLFPPQSFAYLKESTYTRLIINHIPE